MSDTANARAHALPIIGDGPIPADRDRSVADDSHSFTVILKLFLRAWPYIRPLIMGRWFIPGEGIEDRIAENVAGGGYRFGYAPFLITLVALTPILGWVPGGIEFPTSILYGTVAIMVIASWPVAFTTGEQQTWSALALVTAGIIANVVASFVVTGWQDGVYTALVTLACVFGWMVQYRVTDGRVNFRIRVAAHLVYFYAIVWLQRIIGLVFGLVLADLLNQSILQAEPLMPTVAAMAGLPSWSREELATLSEAQRYEVQWLYVKISLTLWAVQVPINIIQPYYRVWIMQQINQRLRIALVERWHKLSLQYHSDHRVGDSIFRVYQDSAQVTAVIDRLMGVTITLISYFTCAVFVTLLSPWLGLVAISIVIPALLWARWAMPRMRTRSLVYRAATSDVTSRVQECFAAIRVIKAYGAEQRTQNVFEDDSIVAFNAAYRVRRLVALVTIVMYTISAAFLLTGEFMMAWWANQGDETFAKDLIALVGVSFVVWNLAAFNWTKAQFVEATNDVRGLMRQWLTAQDIAMGLQRVFDILDIEPDVQDDTDAIPFDGLQQGIRFDNVHFAYEPDRPVLEGVSLTAEPSTITAIVGPTGSGKSSLMGMLLRLYDPVEGSITIDGVDLRKYQVESLRKNIAIALQENVLFAMSVRDNIRYVAPGATDAQVREAVRVAGMEDYVAGLPQGLDTMLGDRGGRLSTGQRQRLSIARAVVRDTPLLILDEPTAALDAATEHQVMQNLSEWGKNRAIFLITHRISTIRQADNIVYLDQGTIIENGSHEALMQIEGGRYRSFVEAESHLSHHDEGEA
ncbi:MAG: ABC transporter ATP-binding protein [Proteobacteria bacterium]|nr:ABC transporter ATP-binding protein [Pseudomonadota bacterium]